MSARRLRTVVCGSTFGQFYLSALAALPDEFEIAGVLGRGSERTRECARRHGVPVFTTVSELPAEIDLACVVVRSGVMGGAGTELALALLERHIHVLQEQPVHHDDIAVCLRAARRRGVQFQVGDLYVQLPAVRRFSAAARAATKQQPALFIDAACATQVSFPLVQIVAATLQTVRPWRIDHVKTGHAPLQLLSGEVGGIPLVLRAHHEVNPTDPDNHIQLLHRITLGFAAGSLTLTETHGPVTWSPRLHIPEAVKARLDFAALESAHLGERSTEALGPSRAPRYRDLLASQWPRAIGRDLSAMRAVVLQGAGSGGAEQGLLTRARLWQELTAALGYPSLRPDACHQPLAVEPLKAAAEAIALEPEEGEDAGSAPPTNLGDVFACTEAAEHIARGISAAYVRTFVARLDEAVMSSMMHTFHGHGLFAEAARRHSVSEILERTGTAPRHQPLLRRWLRVLVERGWLAHEGASLRGRAALHATDVSRCWDRAADAWEGLGAREFIAYLRANAEQLARLMRDEQQAALLLFPEGRTHLADAVYRDTITARYLNTAVAEAVRRVSQDGRESLRILEVGAGTGATTEAITRTLRELRPPALDYLFTDVSNFFLASARERFDSDRWLRFGLLDIDRDPADQGLSPGECDVVIAAGVLNNARAVDATVRALLWLLKPGGFLLVTEPTREHLEILISQAFMMTSPEDDRRRTDSTFLTVPQWLEVFRAAGAARAEVFPADDHPLAPLGQRLFVVRGS